ncbi:MAG: hypothetical protein RIT45_521 [Pseudomonadota bacterium]|jgi:hypothetical protein
MTHPAPDEPVWQPVEPADDACEAEFAARSKRPSRSAATRSGCACPAATRGRLAILRTPVEAMRAGRFWQVEASDDGQTRIERFRVDDDGRRPRQRFSFTREALDGMAETMREATAPDAPDVEG